MVQLNFFCFNIFREKIKGNYQFKFGVGGNVLVWGGDTPYVEMEKDVSFHGPTMDLTVFYSIMGQDKAINTPFKGFNTFSFLLALSQVAAMSATTAASSWIVKY